MKKIVIIEDELFMREELAQILTNAGYHAVCITCFEHTVATALSLAPDLLLLDLNLPNVSGFEICQQMKAKASFPVLVLTSRTQMKDELHALNMGADDYLTKPCHKKRILARIENLLKRYSGMKHLLDGGGFFLDKNTYALYVQETSIILSENEGKILEMLIQNKDQIVTKESLCMQLWGTSVFIDENALQVNITRLRKSLRKVALDSQVITIRGKGYLLRGEHTYE